MEYYFNKINIHFTLNNIQICKLIIYTNYKLHCKIECKFCASHLDYIPNVFCGSFVVYEQQFVCRCPSYDDIHVLTQGDKYVPSWLPTNKTPRPINFTILLPKFVLLDDACSNSFVLPRVCLFFLMNVVI